MTSNNPPILLVDDIPTVRELLKDMLLDVGFENFLEAGDGEEALSIMASNEPIMVISDYMMSPMSGLDLLRNIRGSELYKNIPFIMITAVGDTSTKTEAQELGVTSYLTKPIGFDILRKTVLGVLADKMK